MKWGLRTKLLLTVGTLIVLVSSGITVLHIRRLESSYVKALMHMAEAPARYLSSAAPTESIKSLSQSCLDLYGPGNNSSLAHFAILDSSGTFLANSNEALQNTTIEHSQLWAAFETRTPAAIINDDVYHNVYRGFDCFAGNP